MSYDIYCYRSNLDRPDLEEAQTALEIDEDKEVLINVEEKRKIAKALLAYNPKLENSKYDVGNFSKFDGTSGEELSRSKDHFELSDTEGDLAIQISIFDNNVCISMPYWYSGDDVTELFEKASGYAKIIRQAAGYFVYDPQTDKVFDPLTENLFDLDIYDTMTNQVNQMTNKHDQIVKKKPWWKFW